MLEIYRVASGMVLLWFFGTGRRIIMPKKRKWECYLSSESSVKHGFAGLSDG